MRHTGPYAETGQFDARNYWTWVQQAASAQIPDVPPVSISPESNDFGASGGGGSFTVAMTSPGQSRSWTVDKDSTADWLTVDSPPLHEPQPENGSVAYTIAPNTGIARSARLYVNGKTHTVSQTGPVAR